MPDLPAHTKPRNPLTVMLPKLDPKPRAAPGYRAFARQLRKRGFAGNVQLDHASRTVQSTDNSIYQRFPQGVLYPVDSDDLVRIAELSQSEEFRTLSFCPRGGGTGTNGQALSEGFIVDLSKHMNNILEINTEERWARVQAGVVKDQLNAAVREHGLFFAPDLSTSNRATIGGMINTDASGQGSCRYGKTRDHVLSIYSILADGGRWTSRPMGEAEFQSISERADRIGEIHRLADDIYKEHQDSIRKIFPPLNRSLTGYDLVHLRNEKQEFDLNSLLCGSEGTLGFVAEAVVNLEPLPRCTAVVVIHYIDFITALRDGRRLMKTQPTAIETIDDKVVNLAKTDAIWPRVREFFPSQGEPLGAVNFLEFTADSKDELDRHLKEFRQGLENGEGASGRLGFVEVRNGDAIARLWTMRKRSVGLLGKMAGRKRPLPFVEDTAVPPENLADYITEFRAILDSRRLDYGMFGHADAGVIHVRPALDMRDEAALEVVRDISDQIFALTRRYGGVLWGEHGKGLRSEYSPATFGELYPQLQRIKASFDPYNQLNPGKIATPSNEAGLWTIDRVPTRGQRDRLIATAVWDEYGDAVNCNGNAACFNWDPDQTMCPSWKGTRERKYSPKGRAGLMKEWLAALAEHGYQARRADVTGQASSHWLRKVASTVRKWLGEEDFSHEVFDSMDSCLACKACATGCPVQVDVPAFRSAFFSHYFRRYFRPLRHHAIAQLETLLPWAAKIPGMFNFLTQWPFSAQAMGTLTGLTGIPALQHTNFEQELQGLGVKRARPESLQRLSAEEKQGSVILVQDIFTRYFEPELVLDTIRLLQGLGFHVWLAPFSRNGKPLHVLGFLAEFRGVARHTAEQLRHLGRHGIPLVGLEPSMTLTYRDEYRQSLPEDLAVEVLLVQEWLAGQAGRLRQYRSRFAPGEFRLLPHCSESSLAGSTLEHWQTVFQALDCRLDIETVGCCGMAGTYGHETAHAATSRRIYDLSWAAKVRRNGSSPCATGFSCRSQVKRFSDRSIPHPLQLLAGQMDR